MHTRRPNRSAYCRGAATPASLRPGNTQSGLVGAYASAIGDSINYFWDRYILTFGLGDQVALAAEVYLRMRRTMRGMNLSGRQTAKQIFSVRYLFIVAAFVALGMIVYWIAQRRRPA